MQEFLKAIHASCKILRGVNFQSSKKLSMFLFQTVSVAGSEAGLLLSRSSKLLGIGNWWENQFSPRSVRNSNIKSRASWSATFTKLVHVWIIPLWKEAGHSFGLLKSMSGSILDHDLGFSSSVCAPRLFSNQNEASPPRGIDPFSDRFLSGILRVNQLTQLATYRHNQLRTVGSKVGNWLDPKSDLGRIRPFVTG